VSTSDPAGKPWTVRQIAKLSPQSVLDVGPGEGHYLEFIRGLSITGVFIAKFNNEKAKDDN
jgi:hypothetical protein